MRTFNPVRCERRVRDSFVDKWGRTITLTGQHAFGYNIIIQDKNKDTSFPYPCGIAARKVFNELKKVR